MNRLNLLLLTLLCCLASLASAGCATTPPPTGSTAMSGKPGPAMKGGPAVSPAVKVHAGEGTVLLARITKTLHEEAVVDPVDAARVVELLPEDPGSWLAAGLASFRAGDLTAAMERLTRSAALDPVNPVTLMALGETAIEIGDLTRADHYFSIAHEASPTIQSANRLALLRIEGGYLESARDILQETLSAYPGDLMTRNNLAVALDMMGTTSVGINILAGDELADPRLLRTRALLELKEGHPDEATMDLETVFEAGSPDGEWLLKGTADLQQGRLVQAEDKFRSAIVDQPSGHGGYLNLGLTLRRQGRFADAERTYLEGIQAAPDPDLHLNLGVLYELYRGDNIKALEHYRRYIESGGAASSRVEGWVKYLEGVISNQ
ncbi:MAG: tetratricopeptide repeat protein [bacterium]|nr:tetratricopeptide repeat protein [bacterium]